MGTYFTDSPTGLPIEVSHLVEKIPPTFEEAVRRCDFEAYLGFVVEIDLNPKLVSPKSSTLKTQRLEK